MKNREVNPSKNHERLRTLYSVSKLLANFENVEKSFSEIISVTAKSFPLLTAVLIEHWEKKPKTTLWHSADASLEQVEQAKMHSKNAYSYFFNTSPDQSDDVHKDLVPPKSLKKNSKIITSHLDNYGNYIVLPLVVNNLPPHGALQLEGSVPLNEEDLEFVAALADLICMALDRFYKTKTELADAADEVFDSTAKLTFSKEEVLNLENERQLREVFVSLLTHDLRTPLTSALMSAQLIIKKCHDPEMCVLLADKISISINRIGQMISNLLDANLIRTGQKISLNLEVFNMYDLVKATLEELVVIHGERFILEGPEDIEGSWDKKGIRRIIENLCNNAVKYGLSKGQVQIFLVPENGTVQIRVHNEGETIPLNDQKSLFDQFRRSESAQHSSKKGWGLGLALVRGVAEAHGGSVRVESEIENGTNFIVTLPICL